MLRIHYSLESQLKDGIADIAAPEELSIQVRNLVLKTAKRKKVGFGSTIAEHPSQSGGAFHAAASGTVRDLDYHHLVIACGEGGDDAEPVNVASLQPGRELLRTLQELGIDIAVLSSRAETLVINGMNPEPGVSVAEQMLADEMENLEAGLDVACALIEPQRTILAVADASEYRLPGTTPQSIKAKYPNSLDALVVKAVTGEEFPSNAKIMSVMDLYALGRVVRTGLPVTETVMTIEGRNYRVPIGTPIRHLLSCLGIKAASGDTVVLGGSFRGEAVYSLDEGVRKGDYGMFVISSDAFPHVQDVSCINCGECVLNCPGRIQPNLISRYAEYEMFEMAEKHGLHSCFECGLCAFSCTMRRPLLQYIRFAKDQLRAAGRSEQA
ncbi:4Fe-4S dicluster domain-containing protein [Pseudodesulfovibrio senegalensis]|jgi:electron transport complex protein RnfC|uniref:4Fe-4S dicluster domain-containing protein n=1 Tax=Pseudodesulfovibrio senegalensis TaxID=1721087 RepID=A0A6N6N2D2_9BACT|nr:4Fe-4S dicluster domain-containing protein [Pseudodesulfovibrio senegalensis]KAB1442169.1 4Fe-4S dicluster domain-containing protein [Pseudodesulfovibrio senegalensis]